LNSLIVLLVAIVAFAAAYKYYGGFITRKVLELNNANKTPAETMQDGVDYVPTKPIVLFGHHFASIAGLGPIVGPAIAVIWGWAPAVIWVVFGSIFIGAVHDFVTLGISIRNSGRSIGDIADQVIGKRGRILFLLIILFALVLAMGVFVLVIGDLFSYFGADITARAFPEAVIPSLGLIVVALAIGLLTRYTKLSFGWAMGAGLVLMFVLLFTGIEIPLFIEMKSIWIYLLLAYGFAASIMPVWMMLQPRDFLSSFNLYAMLALLLAGLFFTAPAIVAPALNQQAINDPATSLPAMIPFLFITIACGAVSGFHCMVSSGTSSKQLGHEMDAKVVGYGGMITEGFLAVLVILACTAGYTATQWSSVYSGWIGGKGAGYTIGAFVNGAASIVSGLGIPAHVAEAFFAVTVVAFAMTSLDTGTRLVRFTVQELSAAFKLPAFFTDRLGSSLIAIGLIGYFALIKIDGKPAGIALWKLFGTSNQLLAGIALLVATLYFFKQKKPTWFTFIPMLFMIIITAVALTLSINGWLEAGFQTNGPLIIAGICILCLLLWLIFEATISFSRYARKNRAQTSLKEGA
jgi:carbon starvation protein